MNLEPRDGWPDPSDESFRALDDTLDDGPSPASVPAAAKPWLAEQRLMHGLLRAMHTADAAARESRIGAVMGRIDVDESPATNRGRWLGVLAAAIVFACVGVFFVLPARLPTAEAAMRRAVAELARDVDRRFSIELVMTGASGSSMTNQFSLVTRPGTRFRVEGRFALGTIQLGEIRIGSDGQELWIASTNPPIQRAAPLAERDRLLRGFGEVLDVGYLDIHALVQRLPEDCDVRVVGREIGSDGRSTLRLEALRKVSAKPAVRSARLWCDEGTGMVTRIEVDVEDKRGNSRRLRTAYLGEEPPGLVDYSRPW